MGGKMGNDEGVTLTFDKLAKWLALYIVPPILLAVVYAQGQMYWDFYGSGGKLDTVKLDQCPESCQDQISSIDTKLNRILTQLLDISEKQQTGSLPLDPLEDLDGQPSRSGVPDHYFDHDIGSGSDRLPIRPNQQDDSEDRSIDIGLGGSSYLVPQQQRLERERRSEG